MEIYSQNLAVVTNWYLVDLQSFMAQAPLPLLLLTLLQDVSTFRQTKRSKIRISYSIDSFNRHRSMSNRHRVFFIEKIELLFSDKI